MSSHNKRVNAKIKNLLEAGLTSTDKDVVAKAEKALVDMTNWKLIRNSDLEEAKNAIKLVTACKAKME